MSTTLKVGMHFGSHCVHFLVLSPTCENVFHFQTYFLSLMCSCTSHLVANLMLGLQQHKRTWRWKCKVACHGCVVGQYFMSIDNQHAKKECMLARRGWNSVANMVCVGVLTSEKKLKVFATCCHILASET
jgi:hypothetical protein